MKMGLVHELLGAFQWEVKSIIFVWRRAHEMRLNLCKVRLNIKISFPVGRSVGQMGGGEVGWGG